MSTSPQSSASAAVYEGGSAADGVIHKLQQQQLQQQHHTSSVSQRFHPYLVPYGRDGSASSSTMSSSVDREQSRVHQHLPDLHGPVMSEAAAAAADSPFSGRRTHGSSLTSSSRRLREFIPDHKKDDEYWMKRQKNNEAAKRSREKRRLNDMVMTKKILELTAENKRLRLELEDIKRKYGLLPDVPYPIHDDISVDRSVSPVCVGISSSDDSTPPSSFPLYQSVSRSSPSPPVLDRCYTEPLVNQSSLDGKSLPSLVPLPSQPYQLAENYHRPMTNQHVALQQTMMMPLQPLQQQQQQQQQQPSSFSLKNLPIAEETSAMARQLQSHITTSTLTPAKIGYLQLESPEDPHINPGGTKQLFNSKIRSSSLTDDLSSPARSLSMAPATLTQDFYHSPQQVTISTSEIPLLTFSDLSSDEDEDDTRYTHRLLSPEAPLNLTKRSLSWQPPSTRYHLSNSNCHVSREPVASLRNDRKTIQAAFQFQELPYHELWTSNSKDSVDSYIPSGSQVFQQEHLRNNLGEGELLSQFHQPPQSALSARTNADISIKVESMESQPSMAVSTKRLVAYDDGRYESRDEPVVYSDSSANNIDCATQNASRQVRGGVPLKVWHKRSVMSAATGKDQVDERAYRKFSAAASSSAGFMYEDQGGSLATDASPKSSSSGDSVVNYSSEFSDSDSTQVQSRQDGLHRNTVARKCRENRLLLSDLNLTAATILESENNKLKEELRSLSREVTDLKEIIGKKDSRNGNPVLGSL